MENKSAFVPILAVLGAGAMNAQAASSPSEKDVVTAEIHRAEGEVAEVLRHALVTQTQGECRDPSFLSKPQSLKGVEVSGVTDLSFHVGVDSGMQCAVDSSVCAVLVYSMDHGVPVGLMSVMGSCLSKELHTLPEQTTWYSPEMGGWWSPRPNLDDLRPPPEFSQEVEYNKDGLPVVNPLNLDGFLEQHKDHKVVIMFSTSFCGPCREVKAAFKKMNHGEAVLAIVDLDNTLYFTDGHGSQAGEAFATRLGLSKMPTGVPVLVGVLGGKMIPIAGGKDRIQNMESFLKR